MPIGEGAICIQITFNFINYALWYYIVYVSTNSNTWDTSYNTWHVFVKSSNNHILIAIKFTSKIYHFWQKDFEPFMFDRGSTRCWCTVPMKFIFLLFQTEKVYQQTVRIHSWCEYSQQWRFNNSKLYKMLSNLILSKLVCILNREIIISYCCCLV